MSRPIVLNTRPSDQAPELSRLLREAGFEPLEAPAIEVVGVWHAADLDRVRRRLAAGEYAWLVLPSQNAGRFLAHGLGHALAELNLPIACGQATAQALGIAPALALSTFSAAAVLEALRPRLRPGQVVLVPRSAQGREELPEGLAELGVEVDAPICYQTQPAGELAMPGLDRLLHSGRVSAITLASPSALRGLLNSVELDALQRCAIVCLGETTATAARRIGLRVSSVARRTTMPDLVAAVRAALVAV